MNYKSINEIELNSILKDCKTKRECYQKLGLKDNGFGQRTFKKIILKYKVDISHFSLERTDRITKVCPKCRTSFVTINSNKGKDVCSKSCASKCKDVEKLKSIFRKKVLDGTYVSWNKGLKTSDSHKIVTLVCDECHISFDRTLKWKSTHKIIACGPVCKRKIQSDRLKEQYLSGKKVYGGTTKWLNYNGIKVQGTYEFRACRILDEMISLGKIKSWEYTRDRIKYVGVDGKWHNYLIDFKIINNDGTFYYLETKGYKRENDELKWFAVKELGYDLIVWFLKDIKKQEKDLMLIVA